MNGRNHLLSHIGIGVAIGSLISMSELSLSIPHQLVLLGLFISTAKMPDVDHSIPGMNHRGFSHTFLAAGTVSTLFWYLATQMPDISVLTHPDFAGHVWLAIFTGYSLHIFEDMFTKGGGFNIEPFWPLSSESFSIGFLKSDSPVFMVVSWGIFLGGVAFALDVHGVISIDIHLFEFIKTQFGL